MALRLGVSLLLLFALCSSSSALRPRCFPAGSTCTFGPCCSPFECVRPPRSITGTCQFPSPTCAPLSGTCTSSFRCCNRRLHGCRSGVCRPKCRRSGARCTSDSQCCHDQGLGCLLVLKPEYDGRVCFDRNCSTLVCSTTQPCCPGFGCRSGRCFPPTPPPGGFK